MSNRGQLGTIDNPQPCKSFRRCREQPQSCPACDRCGFTYEKHQAAVAAGG